MISDHPSLEEVDELLEKIQRQECRVVSGALVHKVKSVTIAATARLLKLRVMVEEGRPEKETAAQVERVRSCLKDLLQYGIRVD